MGCADVADMEERTASSGARVSALLRHAYLQLFAFELPGNVGSQANFPFQYGVPENTHIRSKRLRTL